jgi:hypothetical protein
MYNIKVNQNYKRNLHKFVNVMEYLMIVSLNILSIQDLVYKSIQLMD